MGNIFGMICAAIPVLIIAFAIFAEIARKRRFAEFARKRAELLTKYTDESLETGALPTTGDTPLYPIILIGPRGGVFNEEIVHEPTCQPSRIGREDSFYEHAVIYAADDWLWRVTIVGEYRKPSLWKRLLSPFVSEYPVPVELAWRRERPFSLAEAQDTLLLCIDFDDDVLTQHTEPETLKRKISEATSFTDLYEKLRKSHVFGYQTKSRAIQRKKGRPAEPPPT